ncbi:MAG TPA: hypothetical protein VEW07_11715 [Solirubrobacterales bacterium]|nr:hypothetical protein [Solirubrobacterales bacterium]
MKRVIAILLGALLLAISAAVPASAAFGLKNLDVTFAGPPGMPPMGAGTHPLAMTTNLDFNTVIDPEKGEIPIDAAKDLTIELPPGMVGDPTAVPRCSAASFLEMALFQESPIAIPPCGNDTAVGTIDLVVGVNEPLPGTTAVYNLVPPRGAVIQLGFIAAGFPITLVVKLKDSAPYNPIVSVNYIPQAVSFYSSRTTIWGNPADPAHNSERGICVSSSADDSCPVSDNARRPFLTMPRSCSGPLTTIFSADSWQNPGVWIPPVAVSTHDNSVPPNPLAVSGCGNLGFAPDIDAQPTTEQAESPSGLDFSLDVDDQGLTDPAGTAQSDIRKAVVTLPEGVTVNPSVAEGLATCTPADLNRETLGSEPGQGCPQASKVGGVEVETPLLEGVLLKGSIFVAQQDDPATTRPGAENPFDSLIAMYLVIREPQRGILVKLPGEVALDQRTGQLITTFGEDGYELPQFPFSHFRLHLREGARSPLITPPACGTYTATAVFTPWANPSAPLSTTSSFKIGAGVGGSPCPKGAPPFHPGFEAGSINNSAGSYSPFYMRLIRSDGEQELTRFDSVLPPGVTGKIAGVAKCSAAAIAVAKSKTGRQELASPSCPAASQIGRTLAGAGVGSALTYVPGKIYLGGPFAGDPLSIIAITPAVAGPFDAGTVVVHQALTLDPTTAEVQVDGAHSDPIPHILKGVPLKLRDLRVYVDRNNFTLNPTSCDPSRAKATLFGAFLDVFSSADDVPVGLSTPYQAAGCSSLGFKPKLSLKLTGGTKRGDHPALKAILRPRKGDANVGRSVVTLPPSEFIDNAHIQNPCTRVQFNADRCPRGSLLGTARAVTPLLDEPLEGPVYFRSNGGEHPLPDIVADLRGVVRFVLVGNIDSVKGRIRTTFASPPDAPVTKFTLSLKGGKKGLLINNRNLCLHKLRASAELTGQNGRPYDRRVAVKTSCAKKKAKPQRR